MRKEIDALSRLLTQPEKPFVAILGGAKVSDKIGLIRSLFSRVDTIIIGGAMAYTLQQAQGIATGRSLVETDRVEEGKAVLAEATRRGVTILLPMDHVVAAELKAGVSSSVTPGRAIPGEPIPPPKELIPKEWNVASEHFIDVRKTGPFEFSLDVTTKEK